MPFLLPYQQCQSTEGTDWVIIAIVIVDVDGSSHFSADSQPRLIGLVWGLAATRRSVYIDQMNQVNFRNDFGHNDSTIKHCRGYYYYYYY